MITLNNIYPILYLINLKIYIYKNYINKYGKREFLSVD